MEGKSAIKIFYIIENKFNDIFQTYWGMLKYSLER